VDQAAPPRSASPAKTTRLPDWAKVATGSLAILLWGFFFDALSRTARWVLDTRYSPFLGPSHDLYIHYRSAGLAWHHRPLYRFGALAFSNPPIAAYLFLPFHAIGFRATMTVWTVGNLVCLAGVFAIALWRFFSVRPADAWLAASAGLAPAAVIALYPFHSLLVWGQLALALLTLVFVDLFLVPARYRGLLIGAAAAIKFLPALFVVWLLVRREFGAVARVAAAFLVLTAAAALAWPHASIEYFVHILPTNKALLLAVDPSRIAITAHTWIFGVGRLPNQSLRGMLGRPPFLFFGTFPWILLAIAVLAVGIWATVRLLAQRRDLTAFVTLMVVTMLASPVSWLHYWVFVALAPLVAVLEWRRDRALAVAAIALTLSTMANLEDLRLISVGFTSMSPVALFVVRNLYVLGALAFVCTAAARARRGVVAHEHAELPVMP